MKFSAMLVTMLLGNRVAAFSRSKILTPRRLVESSSRTMAVAVDAEESSSTTAEPAKLPDMEEIVSLCKRRGIIFPSSEIYNGFAGFYGHTFWGN